jgi:hypothetical protein
VKKIMMRTLIRLLMIATLSITFFSTLLPRDVHALADPYDETHLPTLADFIAQVSDGQAGALRGVYISDVLAARVVQQPAGRADFVSSWENVITQFSLASRLGTTGLLAHNDLAGEAFKLLKQGQKIYLVDGNGTVTTFMVMATLRYQALEPNSITSHFLDLESGTTLTSTQLFLRVYGQPGRVVFQTCIQANGKASWGRLFVIAIPVD